MPRLARLDAPREVCRKYDASVGELQSGGRRPAVVKAREVVSWIAVIGARLFGSRSCVVFGCDDILHQSVDSCWKEAGR